MSGFHIGLGTVILIVAVYVFARFVPAPGHMLGLP